METSDLLLDGFDRIGGIIESAVEGLSGADLTYRPDPEANSIAWLVWHTARVMDAQLAPVAGYEQAWLAEGWADRFGLPLDRSATGYGQSPAEADRVRIEDAALLTGYYRATYDRARSFLAGLQPVDLDRVVDDSYDPPVTLGVRLVSILSDCLQHGGQAGYLRGLLRRR